MNLALHTETWRLVRHSWPDAPPHREYLTHPHPHTFRFAVSLQRWVDEVSDDERRVELHDLRAMLDAEVTRLPAVSSLSCEGMARTVAEGLSRVYPDWAVVVSVCEEGQTGATVGP